MIGTLHESNSGELQKFLSQEERNIAPKYFFKIGMDGAGIINRSTFIDYPLTRNVTRREDGENIVHGLIIHGNSC